MKVEKSSGLAEVEISYRSKVKAKDRKKVQTSRDAYDLVKGLYSVDTIEHHEQFVIVLLNRAGHALGWAKISEGGISGTVVDQRIVFQIALGANAVGLVISHNHPSGQVLPSEQDKSLTKKMVKAGELLDIRVLDHIIVAPDTYYSFADEAEL